MQGHGWSLIEGLPYLASKGVNFENYFYLNILVLTSKMSHTVNTDFISRQIKIGLQVVNLY